MAEKYDILMDRRLTLIEKQIQQIDEERAHQQQKRKLEIEILKLDIETKKKIFISEMPSLNVLELQILFILLFVMFHYFYFLPTELQ